MRKIIIGMAFIATSFVGIAQVGVGNTDPKATLDVTGKATDAAVLDGIIAPRLTGAQLRAKTYTTAQTGATVYVTAADTAPAGQTINVTTVGQYQFNGTIWERLVSGANDKQLGTDNQIIPIATNRNITLTDRITSKLNIAPAGEEPNVSTLNVIGGNPTGGSTTGITVSNSYINNTNKFGVIKTPQFVSANLPVQAITVVNSATENTLNIGGNNSASQASPTQILFNIDGDTDLTNSANVSSGTAMIIKGVSANANIGIGTTNPRAGLEISKAPTISATVRPLSEVVDVATSGNYSLLLSNSDNATIGTVFGFSTASGGFDTYLQSRALAAGGNVNNLLFNPLGGNVGIGTAIPSQRLTINGNITTVQDGQRILFPHSNATDGNDGTIGSGAFTEGLNIVGTQTVAGNGRRITTIGTVVNQNSVGIGNVVPTKPLDVNGETRVRSLPTGVAADVVVTADGQGNLRQRTAAQIVAAGGGITANDGDAWGVTGEDLTSAIGRTGNVGIGTTTPTFPLEVISAAKINNHVINSDININRFGGTGSIGQLNFFVNGTFPTARLRKSAGLNSDFTIFNTGTGKMIFNNKGDLPNDLTSMAIHNTGITMNLDDLVLPGASLDVNGDALFRRGGVAGDFSTTATQLQFGFAGTNTFKHSLRTRHNAGGANGNAIDFYVWNQGIDANDAQGTKRVLTLDGAGANGVVDVQGGIIVRAGSVIANQAGLFTNAGELRSFDTAGNQTTISPHNFSLIPQGASEEMAWAFYSKKDNKEINVDMAKLARIVEKLSGEELIYLSENGKINTSKNTDSLVEEVAKLKIENEKLKAQIADIELIKAALNKNGIEIK